MSEVTRERESALFFTSLVIITTITRVCVCVCVGLDKLEFLQSHEVKDIYEKAFYILEKYFNSEIEDCRVAPAIDNNQYQFNPEEVSDFQF